MGGRVTACVARAWLTARSIGRGLPLPVADRGGFRVDTMSEKEQRRWVFAEPLEGLAALGREVTAPLHFLKLCGPPEALMAQLPDWWELQSIGFFMQAGDEGLAPAGRARPVPAGYRLEVIQDGAVTQARVVTETGELAASGFAAETADQFVYDRIVTEDAHQRRGLGSVVMGALGQARRNPSTPQVLVATDDGRALYERLGWSVMGLLSTAELRSPKV